MLPAGLVRWSGVALGLAGRRSPSRQRRCLRGEWCRWCWWFSASRVAVRVPCASALRNQESGVICKCSRTFFGAASKVNFSNRFWEFGRVTQRPACASEASWETQQTSPRTDVGGSLPALLRRRRPVLPEPLPRAQVRLPHAASGRDAAASAARRRGARRRGGVGLTPQQASAGRGARCARHVLLSAALYERWAASASLLAALASHLQSDRRARSHSRTSAPLEGKAKPKGGKRRLLGACCRRSVWAPLFSVF